MIDNTKQDKFDKYKKGKGHIKSVTSFFYFVYFSSESKFKYLDISESCLLSIN